MAATAAQRAWNGTKPEIIPFLTNQPAVLPKTKDKHETEFERQVARLKLKPWQIVSNIPMRYWAMRNASKKYVPEWLLNAWGISVEFNLTEI